MHEHGEARHGAHWHGDSHDHGHAHEHDHSGAVHGHTHGAVDPTIVTTARGIWAIKWSFVGLFITALFQVVIVWLSGSVALLADTIHNFGDAATVSRCGSLLRSRAGGPASDLLTAMAVWKTWRASP